MANEYVTLAETKDRLEIKSGLTDQALLRLIERASRAVDHLCDASDHRRFYAATSTRYFTARKTTELWVPDLLSVTTLKTDEDGDRTYETTWATTDFDLLPYDAAQVGQPYSHIRITPDGVKTFPLVARGVEIAGSWGYCTLVNVPLEVKEATLHLAYRLYKKPTAPLGVLAGGEFEAVRVASNDPEIKRLLAPWVLSQMSMVGISN